MIDCKETLARLYEHLDGELTRDKAQEVVEHLDSCRGCFDRAEFERTFGEFVRSAGQGGVDSTALRHKIAAKLKEISARPGADEVLFTQQAEHDDATPAPSPRVSDTELTRQSEMYVSRGVDVHRKPMPLQQESGRPVRRDVPIWSYVLVAAAVVLIAIPILRRFAPPGGRDPMVTAFVAMHTEDKPQVTTEDVEMLSDWIKRRTSFDPMVQKFAMAGCAIKGAAVDSVWKSQLSHVHAEYHGMPVSVFVTEMSKFKMPSNLELVQVEDQAFWTARDGPYSVVIWKWHPTGVVCVAVAEMEVMEVVMLAFNTDKFMRGPATS